MGMPRSSKARTIVDPSCAGDLEMYTPALSRASNFAAEGISSDFQNKETNGRSGGMGQVWPAITPSRATRVRSGVS